MAQLHKNGGKKMDNNQNQAIMGALGYPVALPQTVVPITKIQTQVQRTQYDPNKMQALVDALSTPQQMQKGKWELLGNALANNLSSPTYEGAYGVKFSNGKMDALARGANMFNDIYGTQKQQERDIANAKRENEIKIAQMLLDADKQVVTDQVARDYLKVNDPNAGGDTAYRFEPERIAALKILNDNAGRWATEWGKGVSDIMDTKQSRAYNEFEGKAKQYVQDQLKKIYGAQMTEAEGERFFKSMGLSPYLAPELRWSLVENALDDLARKSGTTLQQPADKQPENINGFIIEEVK